MQELVLLQTIEEWMRVWKVRDAVWLLVDLDRDIAIY